VVPQKKRQKKQLLRKEELQKLGKHGGQQVTTGGAGVIHPEQAGFSQTTLK